MSSLHFVVPHIKTILNQLSPKMLYGLFVKEIIYQSKFKKLLKQKNWNDIKIKPRGYAANCSLLYFLVKLLNEKKPNKILELGSGETTKLMFRYVKENNNSDVIVLEDNIDWFNNIKENFIAERFNYLCKPLEELEVNDRICNWYSYDFSDLNQQEKKFNLVLIDGPKGIRRFSRLGITNYLPAILDQNDFIIIFDDSSRKGEEDTISVLLEKFDATGLEYIKFNLYGSKKQTCIASSNYQNFLDSL